MQNEKIVVLIMGCRQPFFQKQIECIYDTWASTDYPDVRIMYYDGGWPASSIDGNHICCATDDSLESTFRKTIEALRLLEQYNIEYDWLFRVNTSTFVNLPLLRMFVDEIADKRHMYGAELYSLTEAACPRPLDIYLRGNAILLSHDSADVLIENSINLLYLNVVDDVAIGNIMNGIHLDYYLDYLHSFPHAWFRSIDNDFDCGHALSSYGCHGNMLYYNDFITIQTKMYRQRDKEIDNMHCLWHMMKDAPSPSLRLTRQYMKDPSVFIGSTIGYVALSEWMKIPPDILYKYEMEHKACDDRQSSNFIQSEFDKLHSF